MRETEILRGLGKARAKANSFADGLSPVQQATENYRKKQRLLAEPEAPPAPTPSATSRIGDAFNSVASALKPTGKAYTLTGDQRLPTANQYAVGLVSGPGTGTSDSVPSMLSDGEAVLPEKTVQAVGANNIARLIEETNGKPPRRSLQHGKFADGYTVREFPSYEAATNSAAQDAARAQANTGGQAYRAQEARTAANNYGAAERASAEQMSKLNAVNNGVKPAVATVGERASGVLNKVKSIAPSVDGMATKALKGVGKFALSAAPVVGAVEAVADSDENVKNLAGSIGLDYNTDLGRAGANTANWLQKTGDAATFGLAGKLGRGLGNVVAGESFFDNSPAKPNAAVPGAATATTPAQDAAARAKFAEEYAAKPIAQKLDEEKAPPLAVETLRRNQEAKFEANTQRDGDMSLVNRGNEGVRSLRDSANARTAFNNLQDINGSGVTATRDANGGLLLSNDPSKAYQTENQKAYRAGVDKDFAAKGYGKDQYGNWQSPETAKFVADRAAKAADTEYEDKLLALAPTSSDSYGEAVQKQAMRNALKEGQRSRESGLTSNATLAAAQIRANQDERNSIRNAQTELTKAGATAATAGANTKLARDKENQEILGKFFDPNMFIDPATNKPNMAKNAEYQDFTRANLPEFVKDDGSKLGKGDITDLSPQERERLKSEMLNAYRGAANTNDSVSAQPWIGAAGKRNERVNVNSIRKMKYSDVGVDGMGFRPLATGIPFVDQDVLETNYGAIPAQDYYGAVDDGTAGARQKEVQTLKLNARNGR